MDLELRLIPLFDLNVEIIPISSLKDVFLQRSPFRDKKTKTSDLERYLSSSNNELFMNQQSLSYLKELYIMQVGIHSFVQPLLNLAIDDKYRTQFQSIVSRKPYDISSPFDIYLTRNNEHQEVYDTLFELHKPITVDEVFNRSSSFQQKLRQDLQSVIARLRHKYSEADHLEFTGYYDFISPIFNMPVNNTEIRKINRKLEKDYGVVAIKLPKYFFEELGEAI
jgi:hypothetical protein